MTESTLSLIERLLSDFAWHADRGEGEAMAALFLPGATLQVGGREFRGQAEIAADCSGRAKPGRKVRHVWSNLRLTQQDGDSATGTAVQLTYEQTGADQPTQLRINDLFDSFQRDANGVWRFASRVIDRQMALQV